MATIPPSESATPEEAAAMALPTHSPDGFDLTLIRYALSLKPYERLERLEQFMTAVQEIRDANPHL